MQYWLLSQIQVQQIPTDEHPDRNWLLVFSFLHEYDGNSTWEDLTQTMRIVLPKKVRVRAYRVTGSPFSSLPEVRSAFIQLGNTSGEHSNLGGFDGMPTFLRGDLIKLNVGYRAIVNGVETTYWTGSDVRPDLFSGYISGIQPKLPFTLDCEDSMWLCKQIPTPARTWGNKTLQYIVRTILDEAKDLPLLKKYKGFADITVSDYSATDLQFNVDSFMTTRGSLAALLSRLKGQYRVDSYFRGTELRIGYTHYVNEEAVEHTFQFQKNILDGDKLKWERRDDRVLSMVVKSNYRITEGTTHDGAEKSKNKSTEVLIYFNAGKFEYIEKQKGKDYPANALKDIGERFCMEVNSPIADPKRLFEIGKKQLEKYYYDGFRGSFTTFAIPQVKHGDTVRIINPALPEQNGLYKVKAVAPFGGFDKGGRQEITLDYRIDDGNP